MASDADPSPTVTADLRERLRQLVITEFYPQVPLWDAAGRVPASAFERLAETGALVARWSPASAAGDIDTAVALADACGLLTSAGAGVSFMAHTEGFVAATRRCEFGSQHRSEIDTGRRIGCIAISEATSGSVVTSCGTVAEQTPDGWRINGHKHFVSNFSTATDCVTFVRTAHRERMDDYTIFIVPTDAPGVRATPHDLIGARASGTVMVDFTDVEIDDSRRVGKVGAGLQFLLGFLSFERFWAAIGSVVSAELCLEMSNAWAERRQIGGVALRDHQAILHRLADLACVVTAARALVDNLIVQAREGNLTSGNAAMGKLYSSRVAWRVADETMQLLGGRGYTMATPIGRMWADSRLMRIGGGTDEVLRELVARTQRQGTLRRHPAVDTVIEAAVIETDGGADAPANDSRPDALAAPTPS
jgi:alkylation response protein AidB-like acyl-CoA dehydrogenase